MPTRLPAFAAVFAIAGFVVVPPVQAATFTSRVSSNSDNAVGGVCTGQYGIAVTGTGPTLAQGSCVSSLGLISGKAEADAGHLGAASHVETFIPSIFNTLPGQISAQADFQDFLIFTSSDPNAHQAAVSANVLLRGLLEAGSNLEFGDSGSDMLAQIQIGNFVFQDSFSFDTFNGLLFKGGQTFTLEQGILGQTTDALLRTGVVTVPLDTPVLFGMTLRTSSGGRGGGISDSRFSDTFKLPVGQDVFNLADGVTVNGGNYLINNRFFDSAGSGAPEPATWAFMLGGIALTGAALRRRTRAPMVLGSGG